MIYFDRLMIIFHHCCDFNLKKKVCIINIIMYVPKIDDYLKILNDDEVKDFEAINFSESIRKEQNLRKVAKLLYIFLTTPDEV